MRSILRSAVVMTLALGMPAATLAQTGKETGKEPPGRHTEPAPVPPVVPDGKGNPHKAGPAERPGLPLEKPPQTADEKAKVLSDLYAHLTAAESEAAAKKTSATIERLWLYSGSDTVDLLMMRATKALTAKNFDGARRFLDRVIALAPDYTEGFNRRAFVHFSQSNYEAAVGDLRRVLALDPNHYKAMEELAQIWRETGNKRGALRVLRQLLDLHPFASGVKQVYDELQRDVEGQGI